MGGPKLTAEEIGAARRRGQPQVIDWFRDDYEFLSNFFAVPVMYGKFGPFPSTENAYQLAKVPKDKLVAEVVTKFQSATPAKAKAYGKMLFQKGMIRPDWDQIKEQVMSYLLARKFDVPELRERLLETGQAELIDGNLHHDNWWGDCQCTVARVDERKYGQKQSCHMKGQNRLGHLLMTLRTLLAQQHPQRCPRCYSRQNMAQLDVVPVHALGHFEPDGLWIFDSGTQELDWDKQGPASEPTEYWCYACQAMFRVPRLNKEQLHAALASP